MEAVRIPHCTVRASSLHISKTSGNIKPIPQGTRAVTKGKLRAAPNVAMWPYMGSQQLHSLWLQKLSLLTFALKLCPVPTQGLSDSGHGSSRACPAVQHLAPSCHPARPWDLHEPQHLPSTETLVSSETVIPSGLLLYLYRPSLFSRSSQDQRNAGSGVKMRTAPSSSLL